MSDNPHVTAFNNGIDIHNEEDYKYLENHNTKEVRIRLDSVCRLPEKLQGIRRIKRLK